MQPTVSIAEVPGVDADPTHLSLTGDGTAEAELLIAATRRQRELAAARLEEVLPGYDAIGRADRIGLDTLLVMSSDLALDALSDAPERIDAYLAAGDLDGDRCQVVDDRTNRGRSVERRLATPKPGPTSALNLDPYAGAAELRANHTIVLNEAEDRLGPAAVDLCNDIAIAFRAHLQLNCYVSMGEAPGFGVHWDDHDVLILQIAGRKYWEVEAPLELAPVKHVTPKGGSGEAIWSGVLGPGHVLAIPRGWPHSVQGLEREVSVHLTISIGRPSAVGLLGQLPPESLAAGMSFDAATLDGAFARWNAQLVADPCNGPIEVLAAQAAGYSQHKLRALWLGGAVFEPHRCTADTIALVGPRGPFSIPRRSAAALASALERQWWTLDELCADGGIEAEDAVALVDTLGGAGLVQLRARG